MLTVIAAFRAGSLCRTAADKYEANCSSMLDWTAGGCRGKEMPKSSIPASTTCVDGGLGSLVFVLPGMYNSRASCSLVPHKGERSCNNYYVFNSHCG